MQNVPILFAIAYALMGGVYALVARRIWSVVSVQPQQNLRLYLGFSGALSAAGSVGLAALFLQPGWAPILFSLQLFGMLCLLLGLLEEAGWIRIWALPLVPTTTVIVFNLVIFDLKNIYVALSVYLMLMALIQAAAVVALTLAFRRRSVRALCICLGLALLVAAGIVEGQAVTELMGKNLYGVFLALSALTIGFGFWKSLRPNI